MAGFVLALGLLVPSAAAARPGQVEHFPLPAGSVPHGIAVGPDGNLWFANTGSNSIGRITSGGEVREFAIPTPEAKPVQIAPGPDGNLWFTEWGARRIARITPTGEITEFPIPESGCCQPWGIVAGPDGNVWFTLSGMFGGVGRITPQGQIALFNEGNPAYAVSSAGIAVGPDGNLWVAQVAYEREEPSFGLIGRVTPRGEFTSFPMPRPHRSLRPRAIAAGPDGRLWFAGDGIGRIDTGGRIEVLDGAVAGELDGIAPGPDGNLWFGAAGPAPRDAGVGRITPTGMTSLFAVPYGSRGVVAGPDGAIWFTEWARHAIGRLVPGLAGIGISSWRAGVHRGRTRIRITCSGGRAGTRCRGTLSLVRRYRPRAEDGRRGAPVTLRFARAPYDLASGARTSLQFELDRRARALLRRNRSLSVEAVAQAVAGQGIRVRLALFPRAPR